MFAFSPNASYKVRVGQVYSLNLPPDFVSCGDSLTLIIRLASMILRQLCEKYLLAAGTGSGRMRVSISVD